MNINDLSEKELLLAVLKLSVHNSSKLNLIRDRVEAVEKMALNIETDLIDHNLNMVIQPETDRIFSEIRETQNESIQEMESSILAETMAWIGQLNNSE